MSSFRDKSVLITGAGSGIGRALTLALVRRGAYVYATDIDGAAAARVAESVGVHHAQAAQLDVRDAAAVAAVVERVVRERGRIDYLFNNAGIGVGGEVQELGVAHWDRIIDVNIRGVVHGVVAAYPRMVAQRSGHIVNTASLAGLVPSPLLVPYGMTKHAVVGLSTGLRVEAEAYGVRVSALCPAAIETPILDSEGPSDLPKPSWRPDLRRYLTALAGPIYPVERLAEDALDAVARNVGVIVIPGRARIAWRAVRTAPNLVAHLGKRALADEKRHAGRA
jgi:NAD(P)-dependent dehydrogenase (short-subunit alcohol dehydrogenase family)